MVGVATSSGRHAAGVLVGRVVPVKGTLPGLASWATVPQVQVSQQAIQNAIRGICVVG